jgi:DNA-3-methyladenine glycosylase II
MSHLLLDTQAQMEAAVAHLSSQGAEPIMAELVARFGPLHLSRTDDYFSTLVESIASQQLSSKVADTITKRIRALMGDNERIEVASVLAVPDQALRDAGLSWGKVRYVKDLAQKVADGEVHLESISQMTNEDAVAELVKVKGIGRWTAEMFLMFQLGRLDVWPTGDLGVRKGYAVIHGRPEMPTPKVLEELGAPLRPYRSLAAWYCWRAADTQL